MTVEKFNHDTIYDDVLNLAYSVYHSKKVDNERLYDEIKRLQKNGIPNDYEEAIEEYANFKKVAVTITEGAQLFSLTDLEKEKVRFLDEMICEQIEELILPLCRYCGDEGDHAGVCCKCEAKHKKERATYAEYVKQKEGQ